MYYFIPISVGLDCNPLSLLHPALFQEETQAQRRHSQDPVIRKIFPQCMQNDCIHSAIGRDPVLQSPLFVQRSFKRGVTVT
jgi:hypothetical protein